MADGLDDEGLPREDPALVRPYIRTEPGSARPAGPDDRPEQTWPEAAMLPAEEPATAEPLPEVPAPPSPSGRTAALMRQRLIVLAGVVVLVLAAAGFVLIGAGGDDEKPAALPEVRASLPAPGVTGSMGAAPGATGPQRSSAPVVRGTRESAAVPSGAQAASRPGAAIPGATIPPAPPAQSGRPPAGPTPPAPPPATLAPPPTTDRTGAVTAAGGRCLMLGGILALDGSPIQVSGCSGVSYQSFTLATDGTLRVAGRCAQVTGDGDIRSVRCDDRESAQWRAGPGGTLVNPATGHCLTDPGSSGGTTKASACTGEASQSWTLP